jgi:hypothetical protein
VPFHGWQQWLVESSGAVTEREDKRLRPNAFSRSSQFFKELLVPKVHTVEITDRQVDRFAGRVSEVVIRM